MSKWNGTWCMFELQDQKYVESYPTKAEAMKVVENLNSRIASRVASRVDTEHTTFRYKKYVVVPLTHKRLNALKSEEENQS